MYVNSIVEFLEMLLTISKTSDYQMEPKVIVLQFVTAKEYQTDPYFIQLSKPKHDN